MSSIDIQPITGRIGAAISGVDLRSSLAPHVVAEIRAALIKHKVIFFRDQKLATQQHVAFARQFGEITTAHPTVPSLQGHPEVLDLDYSRSEGRANNWHTDVTFVDQPPLGSVLNALVIPRSGGDTLWSNSVTAYEDLPASLRAFADNAWAVHSNAYDYAEAAVQLSDELKERRKVFTRTLFETLHPLVRVHPESREHGLFIGGFVRQIRDLKPSESADLVRILQSYITRPENTVRWRWRAGDVAFWDNRATQHYAVADYGNEARHVQRVTIAGDVPVAIDGQHSVAVKGDSSAYTPRLAA
jgi:alpha-ketoglutarate-dependent sulfate ester dioxygenase